MPLYRDFHFGFLYPKYYTHPPPPVQQCFEIIEIFHSECLQEPTDGRSRLLPSRWGRNNRPPLHERFRRTSVRPNLSQPRMA
jgi:hypothetical protein